MVHPGADVLALVADPDAERSYRAVLALEQRRDGYRTGYAAGWLAAIAMVKRVQHGLVADATIEAARWTVPCRDHRMSGYEDTCERCEIRDRETFGDVHPDDYKGGAL